MPIGDITLIPNKELPHFKPVKESMEIFIPDIIEGIPRRNGYIWAICGSGGSGKSSMMLNLFRTRVYRHKFSNVFYFAPQVSFMSVEKHPFANHPTVYHELNAETLGDLYKTLKDIKTGEGSDDGAEGADEETQYNLVIIDDFADVYRTDKSVQKLLSTMLIKARHLNTAFIITLQSYYYCPRILRKQLTNISIFKPKNIAEWNSLADELLNFKKEDAKKIYDYVFDKPYTHLDIDTVDNTLYKNFNLLELNQK